MSFAERAKAGPPRKSDVCSVGAALLALPDEERAAFAAMLDPESGWSIKTLVEEARLEGVRLGKDGMGQHRAGRCRCVIR